MSHVSLGINTPFCSSPGKNSWHGDLKTPTKVQALVLALDTEDIPIKTPGMNPIRMPTNVLPSRKASGGKCHNTHCSKMKSILSLLKGIFWSQPQHRVVMRSEMEITNLKIMMIVENYLSKSNISCAMFSTMYYKVTWVSHSQEICTIFGSTISMEGF